MVKKVKYLTNKAVNLPRQRSFRRYIFVGASTVLLDILILALLRERFGGGLFSAVSVAYWTSIAYNFLLNRHWSFEAQEGMIPKQMLQYGLLLFFNYLVTVLVVTIAESIGLSEYLGKILALSLTVLWTYFLYKRIIFKKVSSSLTQNTE